MTLREASGQLAALLRPITHLAADAPLLEQMQRMPQYLPTARDPRIPDRAN